MNRDDIIRMAREAGLWPSVTDTFPEEVQHFAKLVAAAAKREWQGLTDEEMLDAYAPNRVPDSAYSNMGEDLKKIHDATKEEMLSGLRAIEAKLKEKNSGR